MTGEGGRDRPLSVSRVTGVCEGDLLSGERKAHGAVALAIDTGGTRV